MAYDKQCYERRKNHIVKKANRELFIAYREIRAKWGFDDVQIRNLLHTYTKTEILNGTYESGIFTPQELYIL